MEVPWYRQNCQGMLAPLGRGEQPAGAIIMACGPLDELLALAEELGSVACKRCVN